MLNRGGWDSKDYPMGVQYYRLAVVGTGASAPVAPTNGIIPPLWPVKASVMSTLAAEIPTRSGVGVYTVTVAAQWRMFAWLSVETEVMGTGGLWAQVSAHSPTTGVITLRTFAAAGSATDLTSADLAVLTISGLDTSVYR
jgi:hypothetical protein